MADCCPHKHWSDEGPEICSDSAERQTKVHALAEKRVHSASDSPRQVILQHLQELPDLRTGRQQAQTVNSRGAGRHGGSRGAGRHGGRQMNGVHYGDSRGDGEAVIQEESDSCGGSGTTVQNAPLILARCRRELHPGEAGWSCCGTACRHQGRSLGTA